MLLNTLISNLGLKNISGISFYHCSVFRTPPPPPALTLTLSSVWSCQSTTAGSFQQPRK